MNWMELDQEYIMPTYNRLPITVDKAEGNYLIDESGKRYLDLFGGLAVNVLGHSHPHLMETLHQQSSKFLHVSNFFLNKPAITLAHRLIEHSVKGKVYFGNSGAEAAEGAVKLIHKWSKQQSEEKSGVAVLKNSFHGRTLGVIRMTRQPGIYQDFPAADFPVYEAEAEDIASLENIFNEKQPAALLMEPVLGSGGIMPLSSDFLQKAEALCRRYNVLFCMDEIQTGMGRTGELFAYQRAQVTPDIILFAKGIGGGLPLGGFIARSGLDGMFQPGDHGTTFGPSPLSAALGNAVLDVLMEQGGLEEGRENAEYLWKQLESLQQETGAIQDIRGAGMMLGIVLDADAKEVKNIQQRLLQRGFMINITQGTIIRLLPPLTLNKEETDAFVAALKGEIAREEV
ncbi:acetylornithine aminotransferase [Alteribacillus persepolensis]|uniref:Acetylornithine aminotransferase n=1 Tax=Alteribacillus persepolensis TaxID=568899 RepID=A0A1G7Y8C5_9BACI|nr:acetylornithine transaminase [Alteribacillus persepolensis]SDG92624.1 acetylornithine aminotransferase [Alteribacillus persepolensis]